MPDDQSPEKIRHDRDQEEGKQLPHLHPGMLIYLLPPYHPLNLDFRPLPIFFATHIEPATSDVDVSTHIAIYNQITWSSKAVPKDDERLMHFLPPTLQEFADFSQLTATPHVAPHVLLPYKDILHHFSNRVSVTAFVRRVYFREPEAVSIFFCVTCFVFPRNLTVFFSRHQEKNTRKF